MIDTTNLEERSACQQLSAFDVDHEHLVGVVPECERPLLLLVAVVAAARVALGRVPAGPGGHPVADARQPARGQLEEHILAAEEERLGGGREDEALQVARVGRRGELVSAAGDPLAVAAADGDGGGDQQQDD